MSGTAEQAIFVTGAGSGIGRATARLFAERGWAVGLCDVDVDAAGRVAEEIGAATPDARTLVRRLDVRDAADCAVALASFDERCGRLDVLFNCAGVLAAGRFADVPLEEHVRTVAVNVLGVVHCTHALPLLRRTPGAHVVTMGSASGIYGVPELATYSASKFFVRGFTEALSLELERDGIVVTDVMPLWVNTPMVTSQSYRPGSLQTFGAELAAEDVARLVWKAAHGRRVHWVPGTLLRFLNYLGGAFPLVNRPTMKRVARL